VTLSSETAGTLWAYPVHAVSQSESGFELVHQAVCIQPSWDVRGDANGRWSTRLKLKLEVEGSKFFSASEEAKVAQASL